MIFQKREREEEEEEMSDSEDEDTRVTVKEEHDDDDDDDDDQEEHDHTEESKHDSKPEEELDDDVYVDDERNVITFDLVIEFECPNPKEVIATMTKELKEKYPNYDYYVVHDNDFTD